jgi:hypothetical protein
MAQGLLESKSDAEYNHQLRECKVEFEATMPQKSDRGAGGDVSNRPRATDGFVPACSTLPQLLRCHPLLV